MIVRLEITFAYDSTRLRFDQISDVHYHRLECS